MYLKEKYPTTQRSKKEIKSQAKKLKNQFINTRWMRIF